MLCRKDGRAEHIKKSVHFCFHFIAKLPDRMMQPCCKLDRKLMRSGGHKSVGDLRRGWKRIGCHSARAQFVTKGCDFLIGIVPGDERYGLLRPVRWRLPENRQIAENRFRLFQHCKLNIGR